MNFDIRIEGLRELQDKLQKLMDNADTIDGQAASLEIFFDPAFMLAYTQYNSIEEMLEQGFGVSLPEEFLRLTDEDRNRLVAEHTEFPTWNAMLEQAKVEWVARWIGFQEE